MRRMTGLIVGVIFGLCLSQFPEFAQQYEQRLGGAVDELAALTQKFDTAAASAGLTRDEAFARFAVQSDSFISGQGDDMRANFVRYWRLSSHLMSVENADPFDQAVNFAQYYDPQIAARAWAAYQPAVPITPEGLIFGGIGVLAGYGLSGLFLLPFRGRHRYRA